MITLFTILFTASRGAYAPIFIFLFLSLLHLIMLKNIKISKYILYSIFYLIIFYPFVVYILHNTLNDIEFEKTLAIFSSMRYVYHVHYVDIGMMFPFGVGYFNGLEYFQFRWLVYI